MKLQELFSDKEKQLIQNTIALAEKNTSGEIRIHIDKSCKNDPTKQAIYIFEKLNMHSTELKNGILIYLAVKERKLAVIGDKGINDVVNEDFWIDIKDILVSNFQKGDFTNGLILGIEKCGEKLSHYFPHLENDKNELSNEISFGN